MHTEKDMLLFFHGQAPAAVQYDKERQRKKMMEPTGTIVFLVVRASLQRRTDEF